MKGLIKILSLTLLMFLMHTICRSQTRNELEKQRMQIIRDIEKTSKELEKTKSSKEQNLTKLKILEAQMSSRKKLLSNLQYEVKINDDIFRVKSETARLNTENAQLASDYGTVNSNSGKLNEAQANINFLKTKLKNDSLLMMQII